MTRVLTLVVRAHFRHDDQGGLHAVRGEQLREVERPDAVQTDLREPGEDLRHALRERRVLRGRALAVRQQARAELGALGRVLLDARAVVREELLAVAPVVVRVHREGRVLELEQPREPALRGLVAALDVVHEEHPGRDSQSESSAGCVGRGSHYVLLEAAGREVAKVLLDNLPHKRGEDCVHGGSVVLRRGIPLAREAVDELLDDDERIVARQLACHRPAHRWSG